MPAIQEPATRGFTFPCVKCGNASDGGNVVLKLGSVSDFHCTECDEDFDVADVKAFIGKWQAALEWIESAPRLT